MESVLSGNVQPLFSQQSGVFEQEGLRWQVKVVDPMHQPIECTELL